MKPGEWGQEGRGRPSPEWPGLIGTVAAGTQFKHYSVQWFLLGYASRASSSLVSPWSPGPS